MSLYTPVPNNNQMPTFGVTGVGTGHIYAKNGDLPSFSQTVNTMENKVRSNLVNPANYNVYGKYNHDVKHRTEEKFDQNELEKLLSSHPVIDLTGANMNIVQPIHQPEKSTNTVRSSLHTESRSAPTMIRDNQQLQNKYLVNQARNPSDLNAYPNKLTQDQVHVKQVRKTENLISYRSQNPVSKNPNYSNNLYPVDYTNTMAVEHNKLPQQGPQMIPTKTATHLQMQRQGMVPTSRNMQNQGISLQLTQNPMKQVQTVQINRSNGMPMKPQLNFQDGNSTGWQQKHTRTYENQGDYANKQMCQKQAMMYPSFQGRPLHQEIPQCISYVDPSTRQIYNHKRLVTNPHQPQPAPRNSLPSNGIRPHGIHEGSLAANSIQPTNNHLKGFNHQEQFPNVCRSIDSQQSLPQKPFPNSQTQLPLTTPKPTTLPDTNARPLTRDVIDTLNYETFAALCGAVHGVPNNKVYQDEEMREINLIKERLIAVDDPFMLNQTLLTANTHYPASNERKMRVRSEDNMHVHNLNGLSSVKERPMTYPGGYMDNQGVPLAYPRNNMPNPYFEEKIALQHNMSHVANTYNHRQSQYYYKHNYSESLANQVVPTTNSVQSSPCSHKNSDSPGADMIKRRREDDLTFEEISTKLSDEGTDNW